VCVLFITRLEVIQYNVIGHNRLNTPIASAYAVIRLHTSVKSSSTLHCIPRQSTLHHKMAFNVLFATAVLCLTALSLSVAFCKYSWWYFYRYYYYSFSLRLFLFFDFLYYNLIFLYMFINVITIYNILKTFTNNTRAVLCENHDSSAFKLYLRVFTRNDKWYINIISRFLLDSFTIIISVSTRH